ncbi:MAG TPA: ABC transporter ATP-binding protein [Candidatus Hydrogenedentes bacterium]|nr:ABC transporter ATP-binding protein [Candidatus Hydrogenedentota bacterium]
MENAFHMDDTVQRNPRPVRTFLRLLGYLETYRDWVLGAVLLLLLLSLLANLVPVLVMRAIDDYVAPLEPSRDKSAELSGLVRISVIIGGLILIQAALRYVQVVLIALAGNRAMHAMRSELFAHLQRLSVRFLDRNPAGRLLARVTNDIDKIQQTIVEGFVAGISDLVTLAVVLGVMMWINWKLALVMLIPLPAVALVGIVFHVRAQRAFLEIRRKAAAMLAWLQENISGHRVVRLFQANIRHENEFIRRNRDHRDEWLGQVRNFAVYFPTVEFLGVLAIVLILFYTGWNPARPGSAYVPGAGTVGTVFAFVFLAENFYAPVRTLADRYNLILEALASSERIFSLLDTPPEIQSVPGAIDASGIRGEIEFREVWFSYDEVPPARDDAPGWILRNINLKIAPGERIAFVGPTGSGKTTLIQLVNRLYAPQRGSILIDGIPVERYELRSLRRAIGMALQEPMLFSGSIADNIRFGDPGLSREQIEQAAARVHAHPFIMRLEQQYTQPCGERGSALSTGQRQQIALARAIAHNPRILLLDEATANIDSETEAALQQGILEVMRNRTAIVVAHRLSTIRHVDRIAVIHHGAIRELGTHDELLALGGIYATLYQLQFSDTAS